MVLKKTEYHRQFKKGSHTHLVKSYDDNSDYRLYRRQVEHWHRHDPFNWEERSTDDESSENGEAPATVFNSPVPVKIYPHEVKFRIYGKGGIEDERKEKLQKTPERVPSHLDQKVQTPDWRVEKKDAGVQKNGVSNTDISVEKAEKVRAKSAHVPKPVRSKGLPKVRPMSAPLGRPAKKPELKKKHPPFVPFGMADNERETGLLKTHNIRASANVYEAALRAQKRREYDVKRREEEMKKAPYREKREKALFNEKMNRETASWDTEYRNHFAGFDPSIYKRNLTARGPTPCARRYYVSS